MQTLDIIDAEIVEDKTEEIRFAAPITARDQKIAELQWLLNTLSANPDMPMPYNLSTVQWYPSDAIEAAKVAKALGGKWNKNDPNESDYDAQYMVLKRKIDAEVTLNITISRGQVCERKVVGTKRVKKSVVVQQEITEDQYVEVEDVEFECGSILSAAARLDMERLAAIAS